jgi:hypothetical protein
MHDGLAPNYSVNRTLTRYAGSRRLTRALGVNRNMPQAPDDDWRLQGQDRYLVGASLRLMPWASPNPAWDHDHCEFCSAKLAGPDVLEALHHGYATEGLEHWVCPQCFQDFHERFRFKVLP